MGPFSNQKHKWSHLSPNSAMVNADGSKTHPRQTPSPHFVENSRFAAHPLQLKSHFSFCSFLSFPCPALSFFFFVFLLDRKAFAAACREDRHGQERFKGVDTWNEERATSWYMELIHELIHGVQTKNESQLTWKIPKDVGFAKSLKIYSYCS